MAVVPGITPFQLDSPDAGGQQQQRVQVSDNAVPSPEPLRPVATPTDTFKRAPAFSDPTLQRVADSLGQLAPGIYRFGDIQQQQQNKVLPGQVAQALAGKTPDEQSQILQTNPLFQNHVAMNMGHSFLGSAIGEEWVNNTLLNQYQTQFDKQNGNFDQWSNQLLQQQMSQIKDPMAAEAFMKRAQAGIDSLRQQQAQFGIQQQQQDQNTLMQGKFGATIGEALDKNASPAEALTAIRQTMATTNSVYARMTQPQQDMALITALQRQAETLKDSPDYEKRFNMIEGLLQAKVTDPRTGMTKSLTDDSVVGGAANDLLMKARQTYADVDQMHHTDEVSKVQELAKNADPSYFAARDALIQQHPRWEASRGLERWNIQYQTAVQQKQLQAFKQQSELADQQTKNNILVNTGITALQNGDAHSIQDQYYDVKSPDGSIMMNPKTGQASIGNVYPRDKIIQDATDRMQDQIDRQYAKDPDGRFQAMVQLYGSNGLINKQWQEQLKTGPMAATNAITAGGDIPPSLSNSFQLWRNLHAADPNLLAAHSDPKSDKFYSLADTAMKSLGYNEQQALQLANRAVNDKEFAKDGLDQNRAQTIAQVQGQLGTMWKMPFGYDLSNVKNTQEVAAQVVEAAELKRYALGMPMDKAVADVAPMVTSRYHVINGYAVDVSGKEVPTNFDQLATRYVQDFAAQHSAELAKRGLTKDDLSVMNVGDGKNWVIFGKGVPLPNGVFPGAGFSLPQLFKERDVIKSEADAKEREAQAHRNDPWMVIGDPKNGGMSLGPLYPEGQTPQQAVQNSEAASRIHEEHVRNSDRPTPSDPLQQGQAGLFELK